MKRLGDLLLDLRNPNTSRQRVDDIVRQLNELGDREEKYRSWLRLADSNPQMVAATMGSPNWIGSPLHLLVVQRLTDTAIATGTNTYITFDSVKQFGTAFPVSDDGTKIYWRALDAKGFTVNGYVIWAANATGYRALYLEGFNSAGASLGTAPLHTAAGQALVDNVLPFSFTYYFNGFDYIRFFVHQTSGGNLTLKEFTMGITLA